MAFRDLRGQYGRRSPEELVAHLNAFELKLKFSVGVWYFSPMASRFHDKYAPDLDIRRRLDLVVGLKDASVVGVEAHYPAEISEDNLDQRRLSAPGSCGPVSCRSPSGPPGSCLPTSRPCRWIRRVARTPSAMPSPGGGT